MKLRAWRRSFKSHGEQLRPPDTQQTFKDKRQHVGEAYGMGSNLDTGSLKSRVLTGLTAQN